MLKFHSLRIAELQPDADDAVALSLEVPQELQSVYVGLPGQHVVLRTELDGAEARRTYSLTNVPGEWPLRIVARVHESGRMSRHLAEQLKVGDRIDVLPPNGSLTPRLAKSSTRTRTYVGFAAGCGITPVVSVVKAILQADPANQFILFYGNSNTGRVMCLEELLGLKDQFMDRLALHFVMSREPQEVDLYNGRVDAARVRELARTLFEADQVAEFFVCGPGDMIEQVSGVLRDLNVGADRIHSEHFSDEAGVYGAVEGHHGATVGVSHAGARVSSGSVGARSSAADDAAVGSPASSSASWLGRRLTAADPIASEAQAANEAAATGEALDTSQPRATSEARAASDQGAAPLSATDVARVTVLVDGRRRSFTMRMNEDTVLDAAERAGLDLPFSCRAGVCSTCRTKVISGEVEMAQNYALEDWELEQGYVLACQSRVKTPTLELDYDEK
jgi:ferredoxin-NADP reductase/ferredoxin